MAAELVPKRSLRGRVPRQFSTPMLSEEQVVAMMGPPKRMKPGKPILPALFCRNNRLSRTGRQQYLVAWADKAIPPSWEDVDDISPDLVGAYQDVMAEKCPLLPAGVFFLLFTFSFFLTHGSPLAQGCPSTGSSSSR